MNSLLQIGRHPGHEEKMGGGDSKEEEEEIVIAVTVKGRTNK
jgi:hypothetical protein